MMAEFGETIGAAQPPNPPKNPHFDTYLPPDAVLAAMANEGEPIATGFAPLDARLRRGGIPPGRIISIGGPPFTGKTTVVVDIALHVSKSLPIFALFSDEGRDQAATRIAVMLGIPLEEVEKNPSAAAARVADLMGERSITLVKPESEEATAEDLFNYAASKLPEGQPAMILLDSIQTIPAKREMDGIPEREAYKSFMKLCRMKASTHGYIVLLTSQSNRQSYRSRKSEENSVAMASFSGTASIEFLSDVAFVLSLPDEASDIVKVEIVKNRLVGGAQRLPRAFHVKYDAAAGRMLEVDPEAIEGANQAAAIQRLALPKAKVLEELKTDRGGLTSAQLAESSKVRKATVIECLASLEFEKRAFHKKEGRQILYFAELQ